MLHRKRTAALLLVSMIGLAGCTRDHPTMTSAPTAPMAATTSGAVQGLSEDGIDRFLGIPYAAPPVGALRWRAPQKAGAWAEVRPAVTPGPICMQRTGAGVEDGVNASAMSEDCLYLNLWRPQGVGAGDALPVMVWIHGGAFRGGGSSLPVYDGAALARRGVVVVTINYRLGAFGVFSHPGLRAEGEKSANYGLLDQQAALAWVQDNIGRFGGDAGNVTLFGESAGGASVLYQMASSGAQGRFHKAIVESGAIDLPDHDTAQADRVGEQMVARVLPEPASDPVQQIGQLRSLGAADILRMPTAASDTMPVVDGVVVRQPIVQAFEGGHFTRMPLIIGRNSDEAGFFPDGFWKKVPSLMQTQWPPAMALAHGYGKTSEDAAARQVAGLLFVGVNTRRVARAAAEHGADVHVFRFAQVAPTADPALAGAVHTAELPYVFDTFKHPPQPGARALTNAMGDLWTDFAKGKALQLNDGSTWPAFHRRSERLACMENGQMHACADSDTALLDFLDRDWPFSVN